MNNVRDSVCAMLKTHQLASLATITLDGKPWTRYVMVHSDSHFILRSAISLHSRKVEQIKKNPEVHVTFGINDPADINKPYVQLQGLARVTTDPREKQACWFDMLGGIFSGPDDPTYAVLVIEPYRVERLQPGSMVPDVWEK